MLTHRVFQLWCYLQDCNVLPAPVNQIYSTFQELSKAIQEFALIEDYALTTKSSTIKGKIWLYRGCLRHYILTYWYKTKNRSNLTQETRQRQTSTKLIGCLFLLYATVYKRDWKWRLFVKNGQHNHEQSKNTAGNPIARRPTIESKPIFKGPSSLELDLARRENLVSYKIHWIELAWGTFVVKKWRSELASESYVLTNLQMWFYSYRAFFHIHQIACSDFLLLLKGMMQN